LSGTEVTFMARYCSTMSLISEAGCTAHHHRGLDSDSEPSIKDLARHLTAGSSSNAVDIVEKFLSSTRLPSFGEMLPGSRDKLQIDSCQRAALVTFDLAVCSRAVPEVGRELLRIAQGKLKSTGPKHCPQTFTNLKSFIEGMMKLLNLVTAGEAASVDLQHHDSLASLLGSSVLPLEADSYRIAVDRLGWIEKAVNEARNGLVQHSMQPVDNSLCSCTPDELLTQLVDVCQTALPRGGLLPVLHRFVVVSLYFWHGRLPGWVGV